jgi:hypothetical protein
VGFTLAPKESFAMLGKIQFVGYTIAQGERVFDTPDFIRNAISHSTIW